MAGSGCLCPVPCARRQGQRTPDPVRPHESRLLRHGWHGYRQRCVRVEATQLGRLKRPWWNRQLPITHDRRHCPRTTGTTVTGQTDGHRVSPMVIGCAALVGTRMLSASRLVRAITRCSARTASATLPGSGLPAAPGSVDRRISREGRDDAPRDIAEQLIGGDVELDLVVPVRQ